MTHIFTVELSDAEKKALEYVSVTANDWIQNAVHERCRLAIEEMVQEEIKRKMEAGEPISGTKEEIVMASNLPTAQDRHEAALAQAAMGPVNFNAS
jgi:hypothetical protein